MRVRWALEENANARAHAIAWMFAALNTVEPPIVEPTGSTMLFDAQLAVFTGA